MNLTTNSIDMSNDVPSSDFTTNLTSNIATTNTINAITASAMVADVAFSDGERTILYALNLLELFSHLFLDCPFAVLNFFLILRTSILHPNLKIILLCQSFCIFARGAGRIVLLAIRFSSGMIHFNGSFYVVLLYIQPLFIRNFIVHLLVIERLIATVWTKTYEKRRDTWFHAIWFAVVFSFSFWNAYTLGSAPQNVNSAVNFYTFSVLFLLGMMEIFVFSWILKHNSRNYRQKSVNEQTHSLSERYQLTENIRTARQLVPPMVLHFLNIIIGYVLISIGFFYVFSRPFDNILANQLTYNSTTVVCFLIEFTMITYHPFLKRDLARFFRFWLKMVSFSKQRSGNNSNNRVSPEVDQQKTNNNGRCAGNVNAMLVNIHGETMELQGESAERVQAKYFEQFNAAWDSLQQKQRKDSVIKEE